MLHCAYKVRAYAVHCLEKLDDEELSQYLLQLCQVLKFEPFLDSALSRFLLRRALRNKTHVGHMYFWYLQAEMHIVDVQLRYGFMLELYLRNCGEHRVALGHQMFVMERLHEVALEAQSTPSKRCTAVVRKRLAAITFPERFQLPLDPQMQVCGPSRFLQEHFVQIERRCIGTQLRSRILIPAAGVLRGFLF